MTKGVKWLLKNQHVVILAFLGEASNLTWVFAPFRAISGSCESALEGASDGALRAFRGANFSQPLHSPKESGRMCYHLE
jgi:hypothetical protein